MKIKNIIIEKGQVDTDKTKVIVSGICFPKYPIKVISNFDSRQVLGVAEVSLDHYDGTLVADLFLKDGDYNSFYPAIGFSCLKGEQKGEIFEVQEMKLYTVGICSSPNADRSIRTIGEQLAYQKTLEFALTNFQRQMSKALMPLLKRINKLSERLGNSKK